MQYQFKTSRSHSHNHNTSNFCHYVQMNTPRMSHVGSILMLNRNYQYLSHCATKKEVNNFIFFIKYPHNSLKVTMPT